MYTVERMITRDVTEQRAVNQAIDAMRDGNLNCDITDSSTGEVMFTYRNGNVQYVQGNFARTILSYLGVDFQGNIVYNKYIKRKRGKNMFRLISELHRILNYCKGFSAGTSSACDNAMIVQFEGKSYKVTFEELDSLDMDDFDELCCYTQSLAYSN